MKVTRFDHLTADALLNTEVLEALNRLVRILESTPVPYWKGKSEKQAKKSILQPILNIHIEQDLLDAGWEREVRVTGNGDGNKGMCVDFARNVGDQLIVVEVQFGNVGRVYSDFHKFEHLQVEGRLALAILVTLTDETAALTDSGITTFETVCRRVDEVRNTIFKAIPIPMVCLGLSHKDTKLVDVALSKFEKAKVLAGAGAKDAIAFAVAALRAGIPIQDVGPPGVIRKQLRSNASQGQLAF